MWFKNRLIILLVFVVLFARGNLDDVEPEESPVCTSETYNRTCCKNDEFQCNNGMCIPKPKLCDSEFKGILTGWRARLNPSIRVKLDCPDGSDEIGCVNNSCNTRSTACPQNCIDLPGNKSRCECFKGYALRSTYNEQTCVDVNECTIGVHLCSQDCLNLNGTFQCACKEGYELDNKTYSGLCKATDDNVQIIFNSKSNLYIKDIKNNLVKRLVNEVQGTVQELSYDVANDIVYWLSDFKLKRSYIIGAKGGNISVGHTQSVSGNIHWGILWNNSLSIDWTAGNMYWISTNILNTSICQILVSKLDGRYVKTLIDDIYVASNLVLDPEYGKMYWVSGGIYAEIAAAWMNGMFRRTVIRLKGQIPAGLTLDHMANSKLYWADLSSNKVFSINSDGTRVTELFSTSPETVPISMDVFENYLYWITKESNEILKRDKFGRGNITILLSHLTNPKSVKIYHKRRVDVQIRKAALFCRSQCSHLCLHIPKGYSCTCPDGSRIVSLMGELICDEPQEDPQIDPMSCYCSPNACNASSPCDCGDYCGKYPNDHYRDAPLEVPYIQITIGILVLLGVIVGCILSFYKKQVNSGPNDGFNNPILPGNSEN